MSAASGVPSHNDRPQLSEACFLYKENRLSLRAVVGRHLSGDMVDRHEMRHRSSVPLPAFKHSPAQRAFTRYFLDFIIPLLYNEKAIKAAFCLFFGLEVCNRSTPVILIYILKEKRRLCLEKLIQT